jgi:hypothetical protein
MSRLPTPGGDIGDWGTVLNDFLSVEHNSDGTLKRLVNATTTAVGMVQLAGDLGGTATAPTVPALANLATNSLVVHNSGNETIAGVKTFTSNPVVPTPVGTTDAANKSYVDSATGAITQLTWVNVKSIGAVGNFVADDTSAFATAITNYNVVYVPAGHYKISSALELTDVTIIGDGAEVTIVEQTSTTADGLDGVNKAYVRISGIQFKGPASGSGVGLNLSGAAVSWYIDLEDVRFDSWGSHGVYGFNVVSSFKNVLAMNCGGHGFTFDGLNGGAAGTSVALVNCYARNNTKAGYYIFNMTYCTLVGCAADLNGIGYWCDTCAGISFISCGAETPQNQSVNYPGIGFKISASTGMTLTSPYLAANLGVGYWITNSSVDVTIIDPHEVLPTGTASSSITVDSGCRVQLIGESLSTAKSLSAGTTTQIGATDKSSTLSGNLTVDGNLVVDGVGQVQFATKSVDQSVSNTTMTLDTNLTIPLAVSSTYTVDIRGIFTAASGGDIKLSWGALPSGATFTWSGPSSVSGTGSVFTGSVTDTWTGSGGSTERAFWYSGIITTSTTAGTLQFEFAQNTSNATATTMKAGSWLRLTRVL